MPPKDTESWPSNTIWIGIGVVLLLLVVGVVVWYKRSKASVAVATVTVPPPTSAKVSTVTSPVGFVVAPVAPVNLMPDQSTPPIK